MDDDDRKNEGDLIFSADSLANEQMATLIRECSGIVCLRITKDKVRSLDLPQMVPKNTSSYGTAFTVSIEAAEGVTTGVSAAERRAFPLWGLMRVDKTGPVPFPACPSAPLRKKRKMKGDR